MDFLFNFVFLLILFWTEAGLLELAAETLIFLQDVSESDFIAIPRELAALSPQVSFDTILGLF